MTVEKDFKKLKTDAKTISMGFCKHYATPVNKAC